MTLSTRTRFVSMAAAGALVSSALAFAPAPATAAPASTTVAYTCQGSGALSAVSVPLTLTVQSLTDGLTAGTPVQPVLHSTVGQAGSVVGQLLAVVDSVVDAVLGTILDFLNLAVPTGSFTTQLAGLELQLVDGAGTTVSSIGATLKQSLSLAQFKALDAANNPLKPVLQPLTGGLTAVTGGTHSLTGPASFDLAFVGDTVTKLGCTVSTVGGSVATVIDDRIVLQRVVVNKSTTPTTSGTTKAPVAKNPCTAALPKVGSKKTTLKLKLSAKKIKASRNAKLTVTGTYKASGKTRKAGGKLLVCDGTKALGYTKLTRGKKKVTLPKLRPGTHRLVVRYLGGGKAKPATKRIVLKVKR